MPQRTSGFSPSSLSPSPPTPPINLRLACWITNDLCNARSQRFTARTWVGRILSPLDGEGNRRRQTLREAPTANHLVRILVKRGLTLPLPAGEGGVKESRRLRPTDRSIHNHPQGLAHGEGGISTCQPNRCGLKSRHDLPTLLAMLRMRPPETGSAGILVGRTARSTNSLVRANSLSQRERDKG